MIDEEIALKGLIIQMWSNGSTIYDIVKYTNASVGFVYETVWDFEVVPGEDDYHDE